MKNSEIHNGLDRKEIRDLIGKGLWDCLMFDVQYNKNNPHPGFKRDNEESYIEYNIRNNTHQINYLKASNKNLEKQKGFLALLEHFGWKEFDVSDYLTFVESDYIHFIGTEKELELLLEKIREEAKKHIKEK